MSDSDGLLTNNVFTFQNKSTVVSAKGPNVNMNNITGISFRDNVFSSTMQMTRPFERRYAESSYDQRSMSNRREISPMSVRSASDMRQINYNYSYNPQGLGAPRSAFNGRSRSPMSIRSTGTSASVSAVDIVNALKNEHFDKHDLKVIKEAFNKFVKPRVRKRIDKRRYRKIYRRRRSGYDSGEQGSDSSLSSDNRSVRTVSYRDNTASCRSAITDISNFKKKIKDSNIFKDYTNSIRNGAGGNWNTTQSSISSQRSMPVGSNMPLFRNMPIPSNFNITQEKPIAPLMSQKERFQNGHLLPSQRFNRSVIPMSIPEHVEKEQHNGINHQNGYLAKNQNAGRNIEMDSDEDIFTNANKQIHTINANRKRSIDSDDIVQPNQKRMKTLSPCKNSTEARKVNARNDKANNFVFAKPQCPARKSVKEKLISKSAAPLSDTIPEASIILPEPLYSRQEKPVEEEENIEDDQSNSTCNSTSLSMKPSFIKRKLFTQTLDVANMQNLSIEHLDSPQNSMYGAIQKEKHKARKLQQATTQSCFSRDIQQDDNNLLDLISKIVPIDQMNVTNQTNKMGSQSKNMNEEDNDKWDVTSIISPHKNYDDVSDTYTDEEILNSTQKELQKKDASKEHARERLEKVKKHTPKKPSPVKSKNCKIVLEKLSNNIKQFWDTDLESDVECLPPPKTDKFNFKENHRSDMQPKEAPKTHFSNVLNSKKPTTASVPFQNYTFDTSQKFNSTLRIKSHRAPKRNNLDQTTDKGAKSATLKFDNKENKIETNSSTNNSKPKPERIPKIDSKKSKETATKKDKKSPSKKKASKTDKQNQSVQKPINKKQDSTETEHQTNKKENAKKRQLKPSKKQDIVEKNTQHTSKKTSNNDKKVVEHKSLNNKSLKTKNTTPKNNSYNNEENNNKTRAIRSCRANSKNRTADKSNLAINETMSRTLRSRTLDLSSTPNKNNTKSMQKNKNHISRLSNVSFSLAVEKNAVAKRAVTKITNSRLLNADESDVSFSLSKDSPTPRKTLRRNASRNNTINSTPLKIPSQIRDLPISNIKLNRKRTPTHRYIY